MEGRIGEAALKWMETHLKVAKEHDIQVIVLAHHNLLQESRLFTTQCEMENGPEVTALLEQYQCRFTSADICMCSGSGSM